MNPRDFLDVANDLIRLPAEAHWRSAVSRAYYAAFHVGRRLLADMGFRVPQADRAHSYIWLRLANCGHLPTQATAQNLNRLRRDRNRADYDLHIPARQSFALSQVQTAAGIIRAFELAARPPLRAAVTTAVRDYERDVLGDVTYQGP